MKHFESLSAAASAGLLALSMVAMPVFAEDKSPIDPTVIDFSTTVTASEKEAGVKLPSSVTFNFTTKLGDDMVKDIYSLDTDAAADTIAEKSSALQTLVETAINNSNIPVMQLNQEFTPSIVNQDGTGSTENYKDTQSDNATNKTEIYTRALKIAVNQNATGQTDKISKPGIYYFD